MLNGSRDLSGFSSKFLLLLKSEFALEKPSAKLEQWYTLSFAEFISELAKKKITPTLTIKTEWMEHFEKQKAIASAIKATIDATDREIDYIIYDLYGLTPDEIAIIEN